jgi:hypothetical protein
MRISALETRVYRYPFDPPFRAAWDPAPRTHQDATIVVVRSDDGAEGYASGDGLPDRELLASLLVGLAVTLNVSYYVGVDEGYVSVFQGLPYGLGGLDLSRVYLRTNTPATTVVAEDQRLLTERTVTSKDDALRTVDALRTATPAPLPSSSTTSSPSPTGRSSATPSAKGVP